MPVPTWRLPATAAAIALAALFLRQGAAVTVLLADLALLAMAAVDWARTPQPRSLQVTRRLPDTMELGAGGLLRWDVRHSGRRRARLWLADALPPSLGADTRRVGLTVPARGTASASTAFRPRRRGRFTLGTVTVRVQGPFGLISRQDSWDVAGHLRVLPRFASRREAELRITRQRVAEVGLRSARGRGGGTDFDQLRDYTVDDEYRRIDWAASARLRRPIVRTYRAERNQTVLLLVDHGRTMAGRVADVPRLDHALDAAMALGTVAGRLGDRTGLITFADQVGAVVPPGRGNTQMTRMVNAMYALEPRLVESDYRQAFTQALVRFRRRALLVLLTELADSAVAETLLPALPLIVRHHLVIVASVGDPQVAAWAADTPAEAAAAYQKAAATLALAERRDTVASLRARGVLVVDAQPGRLGAELADSYLRVKAAGRL